MGTTQIQTQSDQSLPRMNSNLSSNWATVSDELAEPPALWKGRHEPAGQGAPDAGMADILTASGQSGSCPRP